MYCIKCGKELPSGAAFCPWCGTAMSALSKPAPTVPATGAAQKSVAAAAPAAQKPAEAQAQPAKIPLPFGPMPQPPKATLQPQTSQPTAAGMFFGRFIRMACTSLGVYMCATGAWMIGIPVLVLGIWLLFKPAGSKYVAPPKKYIRCTVTAEGLEVSWDEPLDKFAIAINDTWEDTGSGNKIVISEKKMRRMFDLKIAKFRLLVATITDAGVEYYGEATFTRLEWNSSRNEWTK